MKFIKFIAVLFLATVLLAGCKGFSPVDFSQLLPSSINVTIGNGTSGGNNSGANTKGEYYMKGTFGTLPVDWEVDENRTNYIEGTGASLVRDQGLTTGGIIGLISTNNQNFEPYFGVEFTSYKWNYTDDRAATFNAFVTTGTWVVANDASKIAPGSKAVIFHYVDKAGKEYSSLGGSLPQSATVISVTPIPASLGQTESQKIKITFHCYLYPVDQVGSTIEVTNGEATVYLNDMLDS